jgi:uncharacterized protein (DUF1330 family)
MATQTQKVREYYMARRAQKAGKSATSAGSGRRNIFAPPTVGRNIISQRSRRISESRAPPPKPQETAEQKATRYGIESRQEQIQGYRNILDRPTTDAEHRAMARREIANLSAMSDAEFAQMRVSAHEKYQEYRSHMHSSYDSDGTLSINGQRQSMDGKPVTKENISEFIAEQKKTLPGKDYIRIYPTGKDAMTKEGWDKAKAQEYAINLRRIMIK